MKEKAKARNYFKKIKIEILNYLVKKIESCDKRV
jgi:hypothetical protein